MPTKSLATIENADIVNFTVFPNPAKDELNVQIKNSQKYTFKITSLVGQIILKTESKAIDLKGLATGEYLLSIYNLSLIHI